MNNFSIVVPTRLNSTRLPQKLLLDVEGKTLLQRTYENACKSSASEVIIATDSNKILQHAKSFGATVFKSKKPHSNGTSRIAEIAKEKEWSDEHTIVNVQGDEPFLHPNNINLVARTLTNRKLPIATLYEPITKKSEYFNPDCVKLVFDGQFRALYFSRAPIPAQKNAASNKVKAFKHIGIYAYTASFLRQERVLTSPLEKTEKLEQLSFLYAGHGITVVKAVEKNGPGVNNEYELTAAREWFVKSQAS